jgi:hypothetical protein
VAGLNPAIPREGTLDGRVEPGHDGPALLYFGSRFNFLLLIVTS